MPKPPRNPHIAAAIRAALQQKGLSVGELNEKLGMPKGSPVGYNWASGRNAPAPKFRDRLIKLLGISDDDLTPRPNVTMRTNGAAPVIVQERVRELRAAEQQLSFSILSDGQARLKLDITGPIERISPILLQLMQQRDLMPHPNIETKE